MLAEDDVHEPVAVDVAECDSAHHVVPSGSRPSERLAAAGRFAELSAAVAQE
jgi:hypothetical protein